MANYTQIDATTNIKPCAGKLIGIMVTAAADIPTITVYDSAAADTTIPILKVFTPVAATNYFFGVGGMFANSGIYIVISGTVSATVYYE
jgi:hypothetical protein